MKRRLAIVVSHPIQHFVPLYRALAAEPDIALRVLFASRMGLERYFDKLMNTEIAWQMDMLGGYDHVFLPGAEQVQTMDFGAIDSPGLEDALDSFDPDAVMVYGYAQRNALRAMRWGRRRRRGVLMISDAELRRHRSPLRRLAKEVVIRHLFRRIDSFLSVGDHNEDYYRHYGAATDSIFRAPFTIDETGLRRAEADRAAIRARVRAEQGLAQNAVIALFVGKLMAGKRPGDLLAAIRRLEREGGAPFATIFAGNGELLETLQAEASDIGWPVRFPGFVNVDRLPELYVAADLLVHTSEIDNHPLVCSEAACVGLPMVLSDRLGVIGATDIAREGENALVYPVGDVAALAEALRQLAGDPERRRAMGERSRAIFAELDMRRSVDGVRRAMLHAIARKGRR